MKWSVFVHIIYINVMWFFCDAFVLLFSVVNLYSLQKSNQNNSLCIAIIAIMFSFIHIVIVSQWEMRNEKYNHLKCCLCSLNFFFIKMCIMFFQIIRQQLSTVSFNPSKIEMGSWVKHFSNLAKLSAISNHNTCLYIMCARWHFYTCLMNKY